MRVLEFVGLDVLPQGLDYDWSSLGVDTQHTGQTGVQLELRGLHGEWFTCFQETQLFLLSVGHWYEEHICFKNGRMTQSIAFSIHLVVEHEQDGAANTHVTGPLHLKAISLLGGGSSVPLEWQKIFQYDTALTQSIKAFRENLGLFFKCHSGEMQMYFERKNHKRREESLVF